jgi:hypothetical protein
MLLATSGGSAFPISSNKVCDACNGLGAGLLAAAVLLIVCDGPAGPYVCISRAQQCSARTGSVLFFWCSPVGKRVLWPALQIQLDPNVWHSLQPSDGAALIGLFLLLFCNDKSLVLIAATCIEIHRVTDRSCVGRHARHRGVTAAVS